MRKCAHTGHIISMLTLVLGPLALLWVPVSEGQTTITSSGLNTTVTPGTARASGGLNYNITNGTRRGPNLFHSFGDFRIGANDGAQFINSDRMLPTLNVLSRVTGGNPSFIFGELSASSVDFPGTSFYLINPAGVILAPGAQVNVPGFKATTADYVRFADGLRFNALPGAEDALLSMAPPTAFGFLQATPRLVALSNASVLAGEDISLVGGDINIGNGKLITPGKRIDVVSVASAGEVRLPSGLNESVQLHGFDTLGRVEITDSLLNTEVTTSTGNAGTIEIRGGLLRLERGRLDATADGGAGGSITLSATTADQPDVVLPEPPTILGNSIVARGILIDASSSPSGTGGTITLTAPTRSGSINMVSILRADGNAGSVTVQAGSIETFGAEIRAAGDRGGTIVINATEGSADLLFARLNVESLLTGGNIFISALGDVRFPLGRASADTLHGTAGNIIINAGGGFNPPIPDIIRGGSRLEAQSLLIGGVGRGGTIIVEAADGIELLRDRLSTVTLGEGRAGNISLSSIFIGLQDSIVTSESAQGPGGNIVFRTTDFGSDASSVVSVRGTPPGNIFGPHPMAVLP